ncbi:Hypothetical predicted protein [Octopus vulgaris]|uniref:Uncharacterized protein n=1 Tax=Octopus vulgaris TaxID=6645 RepID=A0AA36BF79_OCTVU|nr:Hypothetical predicted protein [Octopus vulgaris]
MIANVQGIVYEDSRVTIEKNVAEVGISHVSDQSFHSAHLAKKVNSVSKDEAAEKSCMSKDHVDIPL